MSDGSVRGGFNMACGCFLFLIVMVIGGYAVMFGGCMAIFHAASTLAPDEDDTTSDKDKKRAKPNKSKLTLNNFDRIKTGMTLTESTHILDHNYSVMAENEFGQGTQFHIRTKMYEWKSFLKAIHLTFQNGKLTQKVQFGLEYVVEEKEKKQPDNKTIKKTNDILKKIPPTKPIITTPAPAPKPYIVTTNFKRDSYWVFTKSNRKTVGIQPEDKWYRISMIFPNNPTSESVKSAAKKEINRVKFYKIDIEITILVGEHSIKSTWNPATSSGIDMTINYDAKTRKTETSW